MLKKAKRKAKEKKYAFVYSKEFTKINSGVKKQSIFQIEEISKLINHISDIFSAIFSIKSREPKLKSESLSKFDLDTSCGVLSYFKDANMLMYRNHELESERMLRSIKYEV